MWYFLQSPNGNLLFAIILTYPFANVNNKCTAVSQSALCCSYQAPAPTGEAFAALRLSQLKEGVNRNAKQRSKGGTDGLSSASPSVFIILDDNSIAHNLYKSLHTFTNFYKSLHTFDFLQKNNFLIDFFSISPIHLPYKNRTTKAGLSRLESASKKSLPHFYPVKTFP